HGAFLLELAAGAPEPVTTSPAAIRPLVRAIAGPRAVGFRTGATARRALARAGVRAATVGSVIHLADSPDRTAVEVLSHELVHAARPSPRPRFFDDSRHSAEEDLAREVGDAMRTVAGPLAAGRAAASLPGAGTRAIRRVLAPAEPTATRTSGQGTAGLTVGGAASMARSMPRAPAPTVQRTTSPAAPTVSAPTTASPSVQRLAHGFDFTEQRAAAHAAASADPSRSSSPSMEPAGSTDSEPMTVSPEMMDQIVDELADRVLRELERRGGHYRPEPF
ncbi:MAG: hypothetical protein JWM47_1937, partial [Acidimicrobiales bacterium]|nr:hypothetical protein [Acidimicrobiales bacterium]